MHNTPNSLLPKENERRKTDLHLLEEEGAVVSCLNDQVVQFAKVVLVQRTVLCPCVEYVLHRHSIFGKRGTVLTWNFGPRASVMHVTWTLMPNDCA